MNYIQRAEKSVRSWQNSRMPRADCSTHFYVRNSRIRVFWCPRVLVSAGVLEPILHRCRGTAVVLHATMWIDFTNIMLNEKSQLWQNTYCTVQFHSYKVLRWGKLIYRNRSQSSNYLWGDVAWEKADGKCLGCGYNRLLDPGCSYMGLLVKSDWVSRNFAFNATRLRKKAILLVGK